MPAFRNGFSFLDTAHARYRRALLPVVCGTALAICAAMPALADKSPAPTWDQGVRYESGAIVSFEGEAYRALKPNRNTSPAADEGMWEPLSMVSAQWRYRGEWVRGTRYREGDVVIHRGTSYLALQRTRRDPPHQARNRDSWGPIAERGSPGNDGPAGATGPTGPAGPQGEPGSGLAGVSFVPVRLGAPDLTEGLTVIHEVEVAVPSDGFVMVFSDWYLRFEAADPAPWADCYLIRGSEVLPTDPRRLTNGFPNVVTRQSASLTHTYEELGGTTRTYRLVCRKEDIPGDVTPHEITMNAIFLPNDLRP